MVSHYHEKTTFAYFDVPFKPGGYLDPMALIERNSLKVPAMMNTLSSIGVSPFALNRFTASQLNAMEEAQGTCNKKIYGARGKASIKVMLHIPKLT
ncbi:hypothetical protein BCV71DRAFT_263271 [Rhizopus microsporus]|uniref:Uncharacterized protein n=1 Tax=Rhizopus microsporus TaxID=58291 RepID=A0A1X0S477_RHIZD|nr:hypothetical protein BCV71DRAFT_263271 [Rhizopus microsporus]